MPELSVRHLTQTLGSTRILDDVDFTVADGTFTTLLGPSGCGKTTSLMAIAGFHTPDGGTIHHGDRVLFDAAAGHDLPAERRALGVVFQSYALFPHMTVGQNVAYPLRLRRAGKQEIQHRVRTVLELVELADRADAHPHQLSGGQQQRVALARALSHAPTALLLDEPFSNLDAKLRERARDWLTDLQRDLGITTVFVTHDQTEALAMSDQILVMHQGRIVRAGTPSDVYHHPGTRFVAEFLGRCNFLTGTARKAAGGGWQLDVPGLPGTVPFRVDAPPGDETVTLAVRPEALVIAEPEAGNGAESAGEPARRPAKITHETFLGDRYLYSLAVGQVALTALTPHRLGEGDVHVTVTEDAASVIVD
jgi:iron(III) transport system ATP-binding protein